MVKNTKGGNKTKGQARKHFSQPSNYRLRKSEDKNEVYAIVTKLYGNGRILIKCNDGQERNCIIRKKFRGRNKRDNDVSIGTLILAGRREWENKKQGKLEVCDLLEVYSLNDRNELKRCSDIKWNILQTEENNNEEVDFVNIHTEDTEEEEEEYNENTQDWLDENTIITSQSSDLSLIKDCFGEEINVDEI